MLSRPLIITKNPKVGRSPQGRSTHSEKLKNGSEQSGRKEEAEKEERKRLRAEKARLRLEKVRQQELVEAENRRLAEIQTLKDLARKLKLTANDFVDLDG